MIFPDIKTALVLSVLIFAGGVGAAEKSLKDFANQPSPSLIDFFLPAEPVGELVSDGIWGDACAVPRDIKNGLEDPTVENWCYWDGMIVKADDGNYYMYASRWDQKHHHGPGWQRYSKAMIAVSDGMMGPYKDLGEAWPDWISKRGWKGSGHNVVGLRMPDGRYAMVTSEITDGNIFVSDKPEGPFEHLGTIEVDYNGFGPGLMRYHFEGRRMANVMVFVRPDGRYMLMGRNCAVAISDDIVGPYKVMCDTAWRGVPNVPQVKMEDPTIWYSDGMYHIVVNHYLTVDETYHLTSLDGIHNWKNRGLAMTKEDGGIFSYTDGTRNEWFQIQRPTVYIEDGEVKAFNFSVIDVHKGQDDGNDNHGSKVVIQPFDGEAFGKHMRGLTRKEYRETMATPLPDGWSLSGKGQAGFDSVVNTTWVRTGQQAESFVYKKVHGDVMLSALVMSQDIAPDMAVAGLVLRQELPSGSNDSMVSLSPEKGMTVFNEAASEYKAPYFIRLVKEGDVVTAFASQTDQYNWEEIGSTKVDLKGEFYAGAIASSESGNPSIARFKNLDVHSLGTEDQILSHSLDYSFSKTGKRTVEVRYETSEPRDLAIGMQKTGDWTAFPEMRKTVNGYGVAVFEVDYGTLNPEVEKGYRWSISMMPEKGHWKQTIENTRREVEELTD